MINICLKISSWKIKSSVWTRLCPLGFTLFPGSCHPSFVISNYCKLHLAFEPGAMSWLWAVFFRDVSHGQHGVLWRTHKALWAPPSVHHKGKSAGERGLQCSLNTHTHTHQALVLLTPKPDRLCKGWDSSAHRHRASDQPDKWLQFSG